MDNYISRFIWTNGTIFENIIHLIGEIVKPGDKVVNLGAQFGLSALVMGKNIGPEGHLFIFEPSNVSNNLVTKSIKLNKLENITTIYKIGASDKKSTSIIKIDY